MEEGLLMSLTVCDKSRFGVTKAVVELLVAVIEKSPQLFPHSPSQKSVGYGSPRQGARNDVPHARRFFAQRLKEMLMMPVLERALALDIIKSPLRNNVLVVRNPMELEGAQTQFKGEFRMLLKDEGFIQYSHWFRWRGESLQRTRLQVPIIQLSGADRQYGGFLKVNHVEDLKGICFGG